MDIFCHGPNFGPNLGPKSIHFFTEKFLTNFLIFLVVHHFAYPSEVEFWKNIEKWLRYWISALTEIIVEQYLQNGAY